MHLSLRYLKKNYNNFLFPFGLFKIKKETFYFTNNEFKELIKQNPNIINFITKNIRNNFYDHLEIPYYTLKLFQINKSFLACFFYKKEESEACFSINTLNKNKIPLIVSQGFPQKRIIYLNQEVINLLGYLNEKELIEASKGYVINLIYDEDALKAYKNISVFKGENKYRLKKKNNLTIIIKECYYIDQITGLIYSYFLPQNKKEKVPLIKTYDFLPFGTILYSKKTKKIIYANNYSKESNIHFNKDGVSIGDIISNKFYINFYKFQNLLFSTKKSQCFEIDMLDINKEKYRSIIQLSLINDKVEMIFQIEEKIIKKDKKYNELMNTLPGAIAYFQIGKKITSLFLSDKVYELCGIPYDCLNINPLKYIYKNDKKMIMEKIKDAINENEDFNCIARIWIRQRYRYTLLTGHIIHDENKVFASILLTDVDSRYKKSFRNQRQVVVLKKLYDNFLCGIIEFDLENKMRVRKMNKRALNFFKIDQKTLMDDSFCFEKTFFLDNNKTNIHELMVKTILVDEPVYFEFEVKIGEEIKWISGNFQSIFDLNNEKVIQCNFVDSTEKKQHKKMQEVIDYSKAFWKIYDEVYFFDFDKNEARLISNNGNFEFASENLSLEMTLNIWSNFYVYDEDQKMVARFFKKIKQIGENDSIEFRVNDRAKGIRWCDLTLIIFDHNRFLCCILDVTDQKYAQELSKENHSLLLKQKELENKYYELINKRTSLEKNIIGSFHFNLTKNICLNGIAINDELLSLKDEKTIDSFFEKNYKKCVDETEMYKYKKIFNRENLLNQFKQKNNVFTFEHLYYVEENKPEWIEASVIMTEDPHTKDVEALIYAKNINEKKITKAIIDNLVESDYDYISLINIHSGIIQTISGVHLIQGTFFDAINVLESHVLETDINEFKKKMSMETIIKELSKKKLYTCTFCVFDGFEKKYKKWQFSYLDDKHTNIIFRRSDITSFVREKVEKNKQLEQALEKSKKAENAKTNFLAQMSHEIRTPLNAIIGINELLERRLPKDTYEAECTRNINSSARHLLCLINDVLDMNKINEGKMELVNHDFSLKEIINELNLIYAQAARKCDIKWIDDIEEGIPDVLYGDGFRLKQIIINLISNALKYNKPYGSVLFQIKIKDHFEKGVILRIKVEDTGIGMNKDVQERVFNRFERENTNRTSFITGTGLGLSIAQELSKLMGTKIIIDSIENIGTTAYFDVKLPYAHNQSIYSSINVNEKSLENKNILLAEDDPLNYMISENLLQIYGAKVYKAVNGKEAYESFVTHDEHFFDAILMDVRMPIMNGYEATKLIRHSKKSDAFSIPIIALSANAFKDDIKMSLESGMDEHCSKPIIKEELLMKLLTKKPKKV